jgi:hypothetical protein
LEWSAPPGADASDPEVWRAALPALGVTITDQIVAADFRSMPRHEFERSMLNMWVSTLGNPVVDIETWQALETADAPRPDRVVLGLDISPKNSSGAIVAVGKVDDELHSMVLDSGPGVEWIIARLERLKSELVEPYVMCDSKACAALLPELRSVLGSKLIELATSEIPPACEFWHRLIKAGQLKHSGDMELTLALDGASQRNLGDGWAFSRRNSGADITSLCALVWATSFFLGSWNLSMPAIEAAA